MLAPPSISSQPTKTSKYMKACHMEGTTADPGVAVMWRTTAREPQSAITSRSKPKSRSGVINDQTTAVDEGEC
jgi:hypothetical protein